MSDRHPPSTDAAPAPAPARRRFQASDVATRLDMTFIGELCVGVTLDGYRSVLNSFLQDPAGRRAALLAALDRADTGALHDLAHAVKGAAASLGLRAVHVLARQVEADGAGFSAADCQAAAAALREQLDTVQALLQRMGFLA